MCSVLCSIQHVFLCVCGVLPVAGPGGPPTHVFSIWECVLYVLCSVLVWSAAGVLFIRCRVLCVERHGEPLVESSTSVLFSSVFCVSVWCDVFFCVHVLCVPCVICRVLCVSRPSW